MVIMVPGGGFAKLSDPELVLRAQKGDKDAFAELYKRCAPKVLTYLVRYTGNYHKAEDMAVDTFTRALGAINRYSNDRGVFLAWLYTIATNIANTEFRRGKKWTYLYGMQGSGQGAGHTDIEESALCRDESSSKNMMNKDLREFIEKAIARLPARDRQAFILCDVEDMRYEDAAMALGMTVSSVCRAVARARQTLKELLKEVKP